MIDFEKIKNANKNSDEVLNFDTAMSSIVHELDLESQLQEACENKARDNENEVRLFVQFCKISFKASVTMCVSRSGHAFSLCARPVPFKNINNISRGLEILLEALRDMGFKKIRIVDSLGKENYNVIENIGKITENDFLHSNGYSVTYFITFDI